MTFEGYLYQFENGNIVPDGHALSPIPLRILQNDSITENLECPTIVFMMLPEKEKYAITKCGSLFHHGIVTQCIIGSNYMSRRNDSQKDQFCANVAIKVNGKLSNISNEARVWSTYHDDAEGIPWLRDAPTFVMGLSISNTHGQNSNSVICGTVGLDACCIRFGQDARIQTKTEIIEPTTLVALTKNLLLQYYLHNEKILPQRMLIYRGQLVSN